MDNEPTTDKEEALVALLGGLRHSKMVYQDDFEEQFLNNFHQRQAQLAQAPAQLQKESGPLEQKGAAKVSVFERLSQYLQDSRGWNWIYGGLTAATVIAVCLIFSADGGHEDPVVLNTESGNKAIPHPVLVSDEKTDDIKEYHHQPVEPKPDQSGAPSVTEKTSSQDIPTTMVDQTGDRVLIEM